MSFPKKSRRKIIVDGEQFFWSIRDRANHDERHNVPYLLPIQHSKGGPILLADIGYCRAGYSDNSTPVITPSIIERVIRDAISRGWEFSSDQTAPIALKFHELISESDERWIPGGKYHASKAGKANKKAQRNT